MDPGVPTNGWQFFAVQASERPFRTEVLWIRYAPTQQALMRSHSGPFAGLPLPFSPFSRFPPQLIRVLLLRRFWLPLPLSSRSCRRSRSPLTQHWSLLFVPTVSTRRQCVHVDGNVLAQARRVKQCIYPDSQAIKATRLVLLAVEIGGRWSEEVSWPKRRRALYLESSPVEHGRHGITIGRPCLHVGSTRAFALILLDRRVAVGRRRTL